jgi:hypothetical protein
MDYTGHRWSPISFKFFFQKRYGTALIVWVRKYFYRMSQEESQCSGGHGIGHSKQIIEYVYVCYSEQFPR